MSTEAKSKAKKVVRVSCKSAAKVPLADLVPFQSDLKHIDKMELLKLKRSIVRFGFSSPMAVWKSGDKYHLLDGHQRVKALKELAVEGFEIPDIPITIIEAENRQEAKEKVMLLISVFGKVDKNGLNHFIKDAGIKMDFINDIINIPELKLLKVNVETLAAKKTAVADSFVTEYEGMARIIVTYKGDRERKDLEKRLGISIKDHVFIYRHNMK
jgi:hypothetical protein